MMVVLAMNIKDICYYELLAKNETLNAFAISSFSRNLWHSKQKHVVWLVDKNASRHTHASLIS